MISHPVNLANPVILSKLPVGFPAKIARLDDQRPVIAQVLHRLDLAGAEVLVSALARRLSERYRFVFFCLDGVGSLGDSLHADGFDVFSLDRTPGLDRAVIRKLRKLFIEHAVDLVHAHQYTPFFYSAAARGVLRRSALPVLFTEHGRHYPDCRSRKRVLTNRWLLKKHDRVTAVSAFIKGALVANEGIAGARIEVVFNGIEDCNAEGRPTVGNRGLRGDPSAGLRGELGLDDDALIVIQVARLHAVKDHALSVAAFALVNKAVSRAHLVMIGAGEGRDAITADIQSRGLSSHIHLIGARDDVRALLIPGAGADVAMLSSLSEGLSVTLLEAAAAGLPIATTDVGGNREIVIHGKTGLLSPRRDAQGLANNLLTLLRDANLRESLGQAGKQRFSECFTQDTMHAKFAALYDGMLGLE